MMNYRNGLLTLFVLLVFNLSVFSQSNTKFYEISEKIENLLKYKDKSPDQLRMLMKELEGYSQNNLNEFNQIKRRVNSYILPIEIKLARSDIYNRKYRNAVDQTKQIKLNYSYSKEIEKLEKYLDNKLYNYHKKIMIQQKPSWFSLEPSISFYTQEKKIPQVTKISNLNPNYGLGFYVKFNNRKKDNTSQKTIYAFSQIGIKMEFRDNSYVLLKDTSNMIVNPYFNTQISFIYRKTIGIDFGVLQNLNSQNNNLNYSFTTSFFIPIRIISFGLNARLISDLKSTNPNLQLGGTIKINLGIYKPFSIRDREEVKSQVFKFKENR